MEEGLETYKYIIESCPNTFCPKFIVSVTSAANLLVRRLGGVRYRSVRPLRWLYADQSHHSTVFVLQKMAMIYEGAKGIWIAEVYPYSYARILKSLTVIERDVDGVPQKRLVHRSAGKVQQHEVHLMNMEGVQFG